jgi:Alr-MurF fusion protein
LYTISQIAIIVKGKWLQQTDDAAIDHLLLDSRKLLFSSSSLFFALNGPRRSGGSFIKELYEKGLRNFITDESLSKTEAGNYPDANIILVDDVLEALQLLTAHHRKQFDIPVIGITGSNGKTILKEWLYQLLQDDYNIVRSPKSYNSQIGVPLSVWQINSLNTLGVFEAGISQPGEMKKLEKIIEPTIGVFTNIGEAHSEGFKNIQQKVNEKMELFANSKLLVYCADYPELNKGIKTLSKTVELFSWSKELPATLQITSIERSGAPTLIKAVYLKATIQCTIPFSDDASVENAISCWCVLLHLGIDHKLIEQRMSKLRAVEMRMELKQGINNCSVINDSYSADINSLTIALDFLQQQQQHPKRTLVLSDILQSGKNNTELYKEIASILQQKRIDRFIGIGPEILLQQELFKNISETNFFASTDAFRQAFPGLHFYNETILLKGARVFEFEQISHLLEQQIHQTVLEINLDAVTHNLKQYQQLLQPGVKLMAMVKAFSYGSGSFEIANLLQFHKVDYLAVAYADEGIDLRKSGISLPIMVMNAEEATFDVLLQYNLEPELYSFGILKAFRDYLKRSAITNYPVHLKLDTGMHRLGFVKSDIVALCNELKADTTFKIQTVFSHLAASDSAEHDKFTQQQAASFIESCVLLQKEIPYPFTRHIANTSAIHRHKNLQFDMVRLGIGLYGVDGDANMQQQLKNVTTLKTTISQIKKVKAGESIGYSRKGTVDHDAMIATVRIGYADGYPRLLSNAAGKMSVNGELVPVIGNVCMDMTMLDVTDATVKEGDEVIVFGEALPVSILAKWAQTIPYEILTGISQRVKRVYFDF